MPEIDLFNLVKDYSDKPKLLKVLIFKLVERLLREGSGFTETQKQKLAKLRSYIEINFKDF